MEPIPLVRASVLSPHLEALSALGAPLERLLAASRLPPAEALSPDVLIPYQQALAFGAATRRETGVANWSALVAQHTSVDRLGSWGRLLGGVPTLGQLLDTLVKTANLHTSGARWWTETRGTDVWLCQELDRRLLQHREESVVPTFAFAIGLVRLVLGPSWRPREVALTAPAPIPWEWLGDEVPARVTGITAFPVPRRLLGTLAPRFRALASNGIGAVRASLEESAPALDLAGSVRQAVEVLARRGELQIEALAEIVGLPVRTLQRRLAHEGLHFRSLVQEVQFARALHRMLDPTVKLIEVAFDLGFSDPAHFTRAFRRWSGVAPRTFRQRLLAGNASGRPRNPGGGATAT